MSKTRIRHVKSAARVLDILEFFAAHPKPATLSDLALGLDIPKSSAHALLETLRARGYIYWLGRDYGYYPTRRWYEHATIFLQHDPIDKIAPKLLRELSELTGETAILAKQEGDRVLYLAVFEPERTLRFSAYVGETKPIHSAASGRALLGLMSPEERQAQLQELDLVSYSEQTITDLAQLEMLIERGVCNGYHVAVGEYQAGTTAIAVGVDFDSEAYALVIGGPSARVASREEEVGQKIISFARKFKAAFSL